MSGRFTEWRPSSWRRRRGDTFTRLLSAVRSERVQTGFRTERSPQICTGFIFLATRLEAHTSHFLMRFDLCGVLLIAPNRIKTDSFSDLITRVILGLGIGCKVMATEREGKKVYVSRCAHHDAFVVGMFCVTRA